MTRCCGCIATASVLMMAAGAEATILGQHHLSWWDDPMLGVMVTPQGAPAPTAASVHFMDMNEWHLDQAQTTMWYGGMGIPGLPTNPFNAGNRNGLLGAINPVAGSEAFIYEIVNVTYGSGNSPVPGGPPFSFTTGVGINDLSGINITDTHGALPISLPTAGSQFMFSSNMAVGSILDMTPGAVPGMNNQDWDFNAFSGPGNFEWDIVPGNGVGAFIGGRSVVFGYAMPGNWFDALNDGWVHSWDQVPMQVNIANAIRGFSGPLIPTPGGLLLIGLGTLAATRRRRWFE